MEIIKNKSSGFTLIELMVVVVIVAIFAAIAIPSYQGYVRRALASQTQQEMLRLATLLDRHKSRNFSYRGFTTLSQTIPAGATGTAIKYSLTIKDGNDTDLDLTDDDAPGQSWAIQAISSDAKNYSMLLTSTGLRCKNKTAANVSFESCGSESTGREEW